MSPLPRPVSSQRLELKSKKFATLWGSYSSLAFSGLETSVVFANMGFFQGRRIKQLFNYKQVTLGNKHRNSPGLWRQSWKKSGSHSFGFNIKIVTLFFKQKGQGTRTIRLELNSHRGLVTKLWAQAHVNPIGQHCACARAGFLLRNWPTFKSPPGPH